MNIYGSTLTKHANKYNHCIIILIDYIFQLKPVSEVEIVKIVNDLRGGSSPGVDDGIPTDINKSNIFYLKKPLLDIVNLSMSKGVFPNCFKMVKVILIYKSRPKNKKISFRQITLASIISKVLKNCVKSQLNKLYLNNYNILFKN